MLKAKDRDAIVEWLANADRQELIALAQYASNEFLDFQSSLNKSGPFERETYEALGRDIAAIDFLAGYINFLEDVPMVTVNGRQFIVEVLRDDVLEVIASLLADYREMVADGDAS